MKRMIFKKAFLLGGVFLLATCMSVQLSWSCDDDDKWDCDHHDKWDCQKYGKPCQPPKIQRVFLEYQTNSIIFEIWGKNFDNGVTPVVTLGGEIVLTVDDTLTDDNVITATLSSITEKKFAFGDYRLVVSTCRGSACNDKYCKDHGPNCKCKYCKDHCSKCKDKYCKDKDNEYKCRCKDRYALTIPGPPTPPGTIGLKIKSKTIDLPPTEGIFNIRDNVGCDDESRVTGGGFACPDCTVCLECPSLRITVSEPLQDGQNNGIGWRVVGTYTGAPAKLTIHAICAAVQ